MFINHDGLRHATVTAILNANYIAQRLEPQRHPVLYRGENGLAAHERILDLRIRSRTAPASASTTWPSA